MSTISQMTCMAAGWRADLLETGVLFMEPGELGPKGALEGPVEVPVNALLLRGHRTTVLVDGGSGILEGWYRGEGPGLGIVLGRAGVASAEVGLVVVTHLDFDHVGGLLAGEWPTDLRPAFPSAPAVVLDDAVASALRRDPDAPWNSATRTVSALEKHGLLRPAADGEEVAPGLRLRAAPGHRSGHACLEVAGGGVNPLLHLADLIHHPLHVEHPEWDGAHDSDRELGLATRLALLDEAAGRGAVVAASHVRGFGRIRRRDGRGLAWSSLSA